MHMMRPARVRSQCEFSQLLSRIAGGLGSAYLLKQDFIRVIMIRFAREKSRPGETLNGMLPRRVKNPWWWRWLYAWRQSYIRDSQYFSLRYDPLVAGRIQAWPGQSCSARSMPSNTTCVPAIAWTLDLLFAPCFACSRF